MIALPRRAILWAFLFAVVVVAVAGFAQEATAQVYRGTLVSPVLPGIVDVTVIVQPGGPASMLFAFSGRVFATGILVANVAGSSVFGFWQLTAPIPSRQCFFQGTYDGTTAILTLEPISCGAPGTITLSRAA